MEVKPREEFWKCIGVTPTEVLENGVLVKKDIPDSDEVIAEYAASTVNMLRNCAYSEALNKKLSEKGWVISTAQGLEMLLDPLPEPEKKESIGMVFRKFSKVYSGKLGANPGRTARYNIKSEQRAYERTRVKLVGLWLGHKKVGNGYGWLPVEDENLSLEERREKMLERHEREISEFMKQSDQQTKIGEPQKASIKENPTCRKHHEISGRNKTPKVVKFDIVDDDDDDDDDDDVDSDEEHTAKRLCTRPSVVSPKLCACLTFENGETFHVHEGTAFTIGRNPTSNFVATDRRVSGNHCKISYKDGVATLEDTSTGGTWVYTNPKLQDTSTGDTWVYTNPRLLKSTKELTSGDRVLIYNQVGETTATNAVFKFTLI